MRARRPSCIFIVSLLFGASAAAHSESAVSFEEPNAWNRTRIEGFRRLHTDDRPNRITENGFHFVRCRNRADAYAAAWLAPRKLMLATPFDNRLTLEWHSFNIFARSRVTWKTKTYHSFYVVHLSAFEHAVAGGGKRNSLDVKGEKKVAEFSNAYRERECKAHDDGWMPPSHYNSIVGAVPFFAGELTLGDGDNVTLTGNAHAISSHEIKTTWMLATVCSMLEWMAHVVVGVCTDMDFQAAQKELRGVGREHQVHVQKFDCDRPVYLPYILLRTVQKRLKIEKNGPHKDLWGNISHVYFSEMDQPLEVNSSETFEAVINLAKGDDCVAPNRMLKIKGSPPTSFSIKYLKVIGQNKCD